MAMAEPAVALPSASSYPRVSVSEKNGSSGGGKGWRSSGGGSKGSKEDEWELERRARIEKVSYSSSAVKYSVAQQRRTA